MTPRSTEEAPPEGARLLKAYEAKKCRKALGRRSIKSRMSRKGKDRSEKLGRHRWVVERTFSWLNRHRRLKIRYERTLRAASRYPPGVPPSGMRVDLLELRPAVALASSVAHLVLCLYDICTISNR
jgi:hypothetical protein